MVNAHTLDRCSKPSRILKEWNRYLNVNSKVLVRWERIFEELSAKIYILRDSQRSMMQTSTALAFRSAGESWSNACDRMARYKIILQFGSSKILWPFWNNSRRQHCYGNSEDFYEVNANERIDHTIHAVKGHKFNWVWREYVIVCWIFREMWQRLKLWCHARA